MLTNVTPSYAFRRQLSWIRRMDEEAYAVLAHPKILDMAEHMTTTTRAVYEEVRALPLDDILANPPAIETEGTEKCPCYCQPKAKNVQLNIRLQGTERAAFLDYCFDRGLSFREGLLELLAAEDEHLAGSLVIEQNNLITEKTKQIRELTDRIKRGSRGANADKKLKQNLVFWQLAVKRYLEKVPADTASPIIRTSTWQRHMRTFSAYEYQYPEKDGFAFLKLEAVCYGRGKNPTVFVWGRTDDAPVPQKIKIRFYRKREFIGVPIGGNCYSRKGATFLVGYRVDEEGVADLYAAFPMPASYTATMSIPEKNHPTLAEQIKNAEAIVMERKKIEW